jgi:hypothetical protein
MFNPFGVGEAGVNFLPCGYSCLTPSGLGDFSEMGNVQNKMGNLAGCGKLCTEKQFNNRPGIEFNIEIQ